MNCRFTLAVIFPCVIFSRRIRLIPVLINPVDVPRCSNFIARSRMRSLGNPRQGIVMLARYLGQSSWMYHEEANFYSTIFGSLLASNFAPVTNLSSTLVF